MARLSLTKSQVSAGPGTELLALCQTITEDGSLSESEIGQLRDWLTENRASDLPAIGFLASVVETILHDGKVWEVRGCPTRHVGERIALIECGGQDWVIRGTAVIADCFPLDETLIAGGAHLHQASGWIRYKTPHAYSLTLIRPCEPVTVPKKRGCVTFVNLE